jgi:hypothetical protein
MLVHSVGMVVVLAVFCNCFLQGERRRGGGGLVSDMGPWGWGAVVTRASYRRMHCGKQVGVGVGLFDGMMHGMTHVFLSVEGVLQNRRGNGASTCA